MTIANNPAYQAAMDASRLLGGNFKLIRERKRALARDLVIASCVESMALAEAITDCKKALKWQKLESSEQNQMNVLFTAVRVIDGAWKTLPEEKRKAFADGEIIFSTLAKEIKDAETAALKAADEAEEAEAVKTGEAESMTPEGGAMVGVEPDPETIADVAGNLANMLKAIDKPSELSEADAAALASLFSQIASLNAAGEQPEAKAA